MMKAKQITVAIVGSGPSGFFAAEALLESGRNVEIDIIERLPLPFGLIRFGVAPDHQTTKKVTETYAAIAESPVVRFFGNVTVGIDVQFDELRRLYDAVIVATGAPEDAPWVVPGRHLYGVYGCAAFVGWYNGHPDHASLTPSFESESVAIIGMGNVALDIVRILAKSPAELEVTDITEYALTALKSSNVRDIYLIGRRGPLETRFSNPELREIGALQGATRVVDPYVLASARQNEGAASRHQQKNLRVLEEFCREPKATGKKIHFLFNATTESILGETSVRGITLRHGDGHQIQLDCGMVVGAIGFRSRPIPGLPFDQGRKVVPNENGRVADSLYVVGWIKRGPSGVIGTSKPDAAEAARAILQGLPNGGAKPGRSQLVALLERQRVRWIDFEGWKLIDRLERRNARPGAPRQKFYRVAEIMAHAQVE